MRYCRRSLIYFALIFLLAGMPCLAGSPTPGGTMPDLQPMEMADITVAPIAYQGPILSDIGMKLIAFEGPQLTDITVSPIQFSDKTLTIANKPTLKQANAPSPMSTPIALVPQPIPRRPARAEDPVAQARPDLHRQRAAGGGNHRLAGCSPGRS